MESLVTTEWLAGHLGEPDLLVVDSSWHMPASCRSGRDEYLKAHIPGARFLDIDDVADKSNPAPHMLPSAEEFGRAMEQIGIGRRDRIVVYDNSPIRNAARGWFMLHHFGARNVAILDGGFQKWVVEGRPTQSGEPQPRQAHFEARENPSEIVAKDEILTGLQDLLLDARGKGRFEGTEADPRTGVAPGHIPGSRNLPFATLYKDDGTFKPPDELERLFTDAGADPAKPLVASCGSGVTANSIIFALHLMGNDAARLYDGSWSEWGADPATPKAMGPA